MIRQIGVELYKALIVKRGLIIIILALMWAPIDMIWSSDLRISKRNAATERYVSELFEEMSGKLTEEKIGLLYKYEAISMSEEIEFEQRSAIKVLLRQYYEVNSKGIDQIADGRGANEFFYWFTSFGWIDVLAITLVAIFVFTFDMIEGQDSIVKSSLWGRYRIIRIRIMTMIFICTIYAILMFVVRYFTVSYELIIVDWSYSSGIIAGVNNGMSLYKTFLSMLIYKAMGFILISMVIAFVSELTGKGYIAGMVASIVTMLPYLAWRTFGEYCKYPVPTGLIAPRKYLENNVDIKGLIFIYVAEILVLCIATIIKSDNAIRWRKR